MKIKELEAEYDLDFGVNPNMNVSTYLRRNGMKSMAKVFDIIAKKKDEYEEECDYFESENDYLQWEIDELKKKKCAI